MSYIDFEDPILGATEYGRSEVESYKSMKQDQDQTLAATQCEQKKINQVKDRRSITLGIKQSVETGASNRKYGSINLKSRSNCLNQSNSSLSDSFLSEDFKIKNLNDPILQSIDQSDEFQCKNCLEYPEQDCMICAGKKTVNGSSNLVKFLQYVFEFKLGLKKEYSSKKFKFQKNNINNFCSEFYNNSAVGSINRNSMGGSSEIKKVTHLQIQSKVNDLKLVHYNFQCDKCSSLPIIGVRYHCTICDDYDECQRCHETCSHEHNLQKIDKNGSKAEKLMDILSKSQTLNKLNPLRPPPSISRQSLTASKQYRSAIR